ncbi:MAG TPA: hypothetical protein VGQ89_15720 [Candidatus Limnocylindrales bacterium]|jgi:hypothetical protein|nr:hypothetical protein [Candidatus Limnocylindrales bacterium]
MAHKRGTITLDIQWVRLTEESCVAVTSLGGFTIRGERSETPFLALRSLFKGLAGSPEVSSHTDAAIALDMALAGTTIEELAQIPAGGDEDRKSTGS